MLKAIKHQLMQKSREKKYTQLITLASLEPGEKVLDVGIADHEYSPFDNYFEKKYPHPEDITALSIEPLKEFPGKYPNIKVVIYNGGVFPFQQKDFSLVVSNAVIEHVGDGQKQIQFINEMNRVGKRFYFTTPAREFPLEVHTNLPLVHWLPKKTSDSIYSGVGKSWATGNYMHLLTRNCLEDLLKKSDVKQYRIYTNYLGPFPLHYSVFGHS